ncbi:NAD(P)H-binding protein [Frankia sp. CNm7]|uniref:NAD(P)H-binding protein n=1 Tax=Frankia nepalensis TaxID=1836974 RepID=A0A937UQ90_9ACTN|nr:NAD(P)H-binding protein [Frankia nepalensis]MBL7499643.1 NAD(P)H-binding protein [Frankia nepalensis]MBL7514446.1 NAD(P)H-binding protein [Frankia nepalensis]MBL7523645.1 NAD(P)H-binding protein [Frankia nepalensis]MBL7628020.1 NAD(P)H-binding protein [Frankia nepalensis]
MARVVVFGASGKIGQAVVNEAIRRGHKVTAVARDEAKLAKLSRKANAAAGDATSRDSVYSLADGADAVVLAVGGNDKKVWANAARATVDALTKLGDGGPRLIQVGHGGTLEDGQGARILDDPEFPNGMRKDALGHADALDVLRASKGVRWTVICPPPVQLAQGKRRDTYRTGTDQPVRDGRGNMAMSTDDLAVAIVDEIDKAKHINKRYTIGY